MNKHQVAWKKILECDDKSNGIWTPQVRDILLNNYTGKNLVDEVALIDGLIDKTTPMKPIKNHDNTMLCPTCRLDDDCVRLVGFENHCPICSQTLDWD